MVNICRLIRRESVHIKNYACLFSPSENAARQFQRNISVLIYIYCVTHEDKAMSEVTATFTFRVDENLKTEFATAAKSRDRTGAQLLRDFMREFVQKQQETAAHDAWFRRQVQAGLDSANTGDLISADEVEAEAAAWREQTRLKISGVIS